MSEQNVPDQETATLALMMDREVDKRVVLALMRLLNPTADMRIHLLNMEEAELILDRGNPEPIRQMVASLLVTVLMKDGSLMHSVRSKLAESSNKHY